MRHDRCDEYLKFYKINQDKIKLLILKDPNDNTKLLGRAIVWKINELDGKIVEDRYFMDRIYYMKEYYINSFINYAKEKNGYIKQDRICQLVKLW